MNCGATRPPVAAGWSIGRQLHSGMRIDPPGDPKEQAALNATLRRYVEERLAGVVVAPSGAPVPGPAVPWKGCRHGRRKDRRWAKAWSPEQIAQRLPIDFPDDKTMHISLEAIYQALFVQGRGVLRRELAACLRTGRVLRVPRGRVRRRGKGFVSPDIMISERPTEAADRAVPGDWEGDLILGLGSSAIGTLVERTTRFADADRRRESHFLAGPFQDRPTSLPRKVNRGCSTGEKREKISTIVSTRSLCPVAN